GYSLLLKVTAMPSPGLDINEYWWQSPLSDSVAAQLPQSPGFNITAFLEHLGRGGIGLHHMAPPHLLAREHSSEICTSISSFRLGNNVLEVEKARFDGLLSLSAHSQDILREGVVDDAMHLIFECTATSSIRQQAEFAMAFQNNNENLHDFMSSPCAPLFVHLALKCRCKPHHHHNENLHDFMLSHVEPLFVHLALKCVTGSPEPLEGEGGLAA
ncbi:hypothetical protein QJQ45_022867, partial [Haematococcus lacustris]